ncbi:hypothetical protein [Sphingomonas sp. IC4-52]|nr:hypothetical protein [Sphingomonas sp. IC4-52]MCC2979330.1 hypothetical protein [Sphingomonas sp. IC4-52]
MMSNPPRVDRPKTASECLGLLVAVLGCLDAIANEADEATQRALSFAAIRVHEAIDFMKPDVLDS